MYFIVFFYVFSILVYVLVEYVGWLPKHVEELRNRISVYNLYESVGFFKEIKCNPVTHNELYKHSRNLFRPENVVVNQPVNKFPTFSKTRRFMTVFTRARHLSPFSARLIPFTLLYPMSLRIILILSIHLRLCLPRSVFFIL